MMTTIILGGHLGRTLGRRQWRLDLSKPSPSEAVRALRAVCDGFERAVMARNEPGYHVFVDGQSIGKKQLRDLTGRARIVIMPALAGAGGGVWQTILGGVLIVGGLITDLAVGWTGIGATIGTGLMLTGASMALGGVSQLLASNPTIAPDGDKTTPQYAFGGPVNTVGVGKTVPIVYGRVEIGSQVVSGHIATAAPYLGGVKKDDTPPPGGIVPGTWHRPPFIDEDD